MTHFIPPERWEAIEVRPWGAAWPADGGELLTGLALLSAFRARVASVQIALSGDGDEAVASLLGALAGYGVDEAGLPDVGLIPFADVPEDVTPITAVRDALVAECRAERRPYHPAPAGADALWRLAAGLGGRTIVIAESLPGAAPGGAVTCVAGSPVVRRQARRLGMAAIPPPPAGRFLPEADVVVADGRRPADLALAAESGCTVALAHASALNAIALEAFGLSAEPRGDELVCRPLAPVAA